jgi:hypothetical protein
MSLQDLIADVGPNGDMNAKLNRAIRLRIIGGSECLDALHQCYLLLAKLKRERLPGIEQAQQAHDLLREIRDGMTKAIARKYGL